MCRFRPQLSSPVVKPVQRNEKAIQRSNVEENWDFNLVQEDVRLPSTQSYRSMSRYYQPNDTNHQHLAKVQSTINIYPDKGINQQNQLNQKKQSQWGSTSQPEKINPSSQEREGCQLDSGKKLKTRKHSCFLLHPHKNVCANLCGFAILPKVVRNIPSGERFLRFRAKSFRFRHERCMHEFSSSRNLHDQECSCPCPSCNADEENLYIYTHSNSSQGDERKDSAPKKSSLQDSTINLISRSSYVQDTSCESRGTSVKDHISCKDCRFRRQTLSEVQNIPNWKTSLRKDALIFKPTADYLASGRSNLRKDAPSWDPVKNKLLHNQSLPGYTCRFESQPVAPHRANLLYGMQKH